jgi:hypothetical protein
MESTVQHPEPAMGGQVGTNGHQPQPEEGSRHTQLRRQDGADMIAFFLHRTFVFMSLWNGIF